MLIYGKNTVLEAIKNKRQIITIYLSDDNFKKELQKLTKTPIILLSTAKMNQKYQGNHQGIVAEVEEYKYQSLSNIITKKQNDDAVVVMLDGLEDPHNLGAIMRSADATGIDTIIIPKNRSVGLNSTVAKVSTGAIEYIDVVQVTNLVQTLNEFKKNGYWVIGLETDGSTDYRKQDYQGKIVIVIGSEGKGISRLVKEQCDFLVNIPMVGHVNSLNASVSASIIFYEILRNRGK